RRARRCDSSAPFGMNVTAWSPDIYLLRARLKRIRFFVNPNAMVRKAKVRLRCNPRHVAGDAVRGLCRRDPPVAASLNLGVTGRACAVVNPGVAIKARVSVVAGQARELPSAFAETGTPDKVSGLKPNIPCFGRVRLRSSFRGAMAFSA